MTCAFRSAAEGHPVRPYQAPARRARRATGLPSGPTSVKGVPSWARTALLPETMVTGSDPHRTQIPPRHFGGVRTV